MINLFTRFHGAGIAGLDNLQYPPIRLAIMPGRFVAFYNERIAKI